jgi:predicted RNase H-like HicB family nuclease
MTFLAGGTMNLKVVLERHNQGGYTALVPSLPGCMSEGDTKEAALKNIHEAIRRYLKEAEDDSLISETAEVINLDL